MPKIKDIPYLDIQVGKDAKGFYALLYRNIPRPSGGTRWWLWLEDERRFSSAKLALEEFNKLKTIIKIRKKYDY